MRPLMCGVCVVGAVSARVPRGFRKQWHSAAVVPRRVPSKQGLSLPCCVDHPTDEISKKEKERAFYFCVEQPKPMRTYHRLSAAPGFLPFLQRGAPLFWRDILSDM